jgi:hypothetical protein
MLYRVYFAWAGFKLAMFVIVGTYYIGSCKSNYHSSCQGVLNKTSCEKFNRQFCVFFKKSCISDFAKYFSYIVAVSFIGGRNLSTLDHIMLYRVHLACLCHWSPSTCHEYPTHLLLVNQYYKFINLIKLHVKSLTDNSVFFSKRVAFQILQKGVTRTLCSEKMDNLLKICADKIKLL